MASSESDSEEHISSPESEVNVPEKDGWTLREFTDILDTQEIFRLATKENYPYESDSQDSCLKNHLEKVAKKYERESIARVLVTWRHDTWDNMDRGWTCFHLAASSGDVGKCLETNRPADTTKASDDELTQHL